MFKEIKKIINDLLTEKTHINFMIVFLLAIIYLLYIHNLTGWLLNDDEGAYLYQSWRMSKGEMPYRDFYTPQEPLFLLTGYIIFKLFGTAIFWVRMFSVIVTMLTGYLIFLIGRKVYNPKIGILSLISYLILPVVYFQARLYRSDAYVVFFSSLALFLFIKAWQYNRKSFFIYSGIFYAISLGYKLSATLGIIALLAFILYQAAIEKSFYVVKNALMPFIAGLSAAIVFFVAIIGNIAPSFLICALGHHVKQPLVFNIIAHLKYFFELEANEWLFKDGHFWIIIFSFPAIIQYLSLKNDIKKIFTFYILTIFCFLFNPYIGETSRYLLFFMPVAILVFTSIIYNLLKSSKYISFKVCGIVILFFIFVKIYIPGLIKDMALFNAKENGTLAFAEYIKQHTNEQDYVMADYGDILFHARRKTTPLMAGMSKSAVDNGVITSDKLIKELKNYSVKMILIHTKGGIPDNWAFFLGSTFPPHHFATLIESNEGTKFTAYLRDNYKLISTFNRTGQLFDIYIKSN